MIRSPLPRQRQLPAAAGRVLRPAAGRPPRRPVSEIGPYVRRILSDAALFNEIPSPTEHEPARTGFILQRHIDFGCAGSAVDELGLTVVAFVSKLLGCGGAALLFGGRLKDVAVIGFGMAPRGEVAMIIGLIGLDAKIIGQDVYVTIILMSLLTTVATPLILKRFLQGREEVVGRLRWTFRRWHLPRWVWSPLTVGSAIPRGAGPWHMSPAHGRRRKE